MMKRRSFLISIASFTFLSNKGFSITVSSYLSCLAKSETRPIPSANTASTKSFSLPGNPLLYSTIVNIDCRGLKELPRIVAINNKINSGNKPFFPKEFKIYTAQYLGDEYGWLVS